MRSVVVFLEILSKHILLQQIGSMVTTGIASCEHIAPLAGQGLCSASEGSWKLLVAAQVSCQAAIIVFTWHGECTCDSITPPLSG